MITRVITRVTILITLIRGLITPLITTPETPNRDGKETPKPQTLRRHCHSYHCSALLRRHATPVKTEGRDFGFRVWRLGYWSANHFTTTLKAKHS